MAELDRFPIWNRWGELTRFVMAARTAIRMEAKRWSELNIKDPETTIIIDPTGNTKFQTAVPTYIAALANEHPLNAMFTKSYFGLLEDHAKEVVRRLHRLGRINPKKFPYLKGIKDVDTKASKIISNGGVEIWGEALLGLVDGSWSKSPSGKAVVVEASIVRNCTVHGSSVATNAMHNRMQNIGAKFPWKVGDEILLKEKHVIRYVNGMRKLAQTLANGVDELSKAPSK